MSKSRIESYGIKFDGKAKPPLKKSCQRCEHSNTFKKTWTMGLPLRKKDGYSRLFPPSFLATWTHSDRRDDSEADRNTELKLRQSYHGRLDEECLKYASLPKLSWAIVLTKTISRFSFLCLFPLFVIVSAFYFLQLQSLSEVTKFLYDDLMPVLASFFIPMLFFWGAVSFLEKRFPKLVYKPIQGPQWELNRQTGMVTLYYDPASERSGNIFAQAPFDEWDGYMLSLPGRQGNIWYRLVLVHQIHEWALPLNQLLAPTTNKTDVLALWDFIRQYMDVTEPLPDMPLFEPYRHLDPTTREHDKGAGRDPNYWRNMDDDAYKAFCDRNYRQLCRYNWENECDQMKAVDAR